MNVCVRTCGAVLSVILLLLYEHSMTTRVEQPLGQRFFVYVIFRHVRPDKSAQHGRRSKF
jgi:hypothetical protein